MNSARTIVLLGSEGNITLDAYATYLEGAGRAHVRAHGSSDLRYTIGGHGGAPTLGVYAGDTSLTGDEFAIFVQDPHGMVAGDEGKEPSFSSQEWFSTLWSFCGVHEHVVNPPSIGAWGPSLTDKLLRDGLDEKALPREFVGGHTEGIAEVLEDDVRPTVFAENLGTRHRKYLRSSAEVTRWGRRGADHYGLRTYVADTAEQLLQLFVGDEVFTLRNDWDADVESSEHRALCDEIGESLSTLRLGFYAVAFHRSQGTVRVSTVFRDVPGPWFEEQSSAVFGALTRVLEGES
jgi:hypothetical protein|tara:strand:- start:395 stop:1267 length:873 start_codon:yes stop_codon:yes gene_type:complete